MHSVACRAGKNKPLCKEICHKDQIITVGNRADEFVPCKCEIGKHEKDGSEREETAALHKCAYKHKAD